MEKVETDVAKENGEEEGLLKMPDVKPSSENEPDEDETRSDEGTVRCNELVCRLACCCFVLYCVSIMVGGMLTILVLGANCLATHEYEKCGNSKAAALSMVTASVAVILFFCISCCKYLMSNQQ